MQADRSLSPTARMFRIQRKSGQSVWLRYVASVARDAVVDVSADVYFAITATRSAGLSKDTLPKRGLVDSIGMVV